eukprot:m.104608 g.104608  ORF g.104608 m.104608 type:complete len:108 (+) comp37206_c0_seq4:771-1094(+)
MYFNEKSNFNNLRPMSFCVAVASEGVWGWHGVAVMGFFSYHQKYLLRQARGVLDELKLSDSDLITSHVAARLNGYLGGYGSRKGLEAEISAFGLSESMKVKVLAKVK